MYVRVAFSGPFVVGSAGHACAELAEVSRPLLVKELGILHFTQLCGQSIRHSVILSGKHRVKAVERLFGVWKSFQITANLRDILRYWFISELGGGGGNRQL